MATRAPLLYRLLLLLLPARFRREFGVELEAVMVERLRSSSGIVPRAAIWLFAAVDVITTAASEWAAVLRRGRWSAAPMRRGTVDDFGLDFRFALRSLARRPGFAATAVTTLALGIGASVAILSVVHAVLLRPLDYPGADRIVSIETLWTHTGRASQDVSGPDFLDWQAQSDVFEKMAVWYGGDDFAAVVGDRAMFMNARFVSADFFAVFGQVPAAGRLLVEDDIPTGDPTVAVVAHAWAVTHFGSAEAAVGKHITVYGSPLEIVGVAAPGFRYPGAADLWAPWLTANGGTNRSLHNYRAVGRLKPGVELVHAQTRMRALGDALARRHPENRVKTVTLVPLQERLTGDLKVTLWVLMGATFVVWLIGCANIANLLLARAATRAREVAIRTALGAGRRRVVRQLLTESLVLAGAAGLSGLLLAFVLVRAIVALSPADLPRIGDVRVDATALGFALALSVLSTVVFGLAPALHTARPDPAGAFGLGVRATASKAGTRLRSALVAIEVALSVVLLASAGLLLRSFHALQHVDLGFTTERVLVAYTDYAVSNEVEIRLRSEVYADVLDRLRALPGVSAAAGIAYLPMGREPRSARDYFVRGRPAGLPGERPQAESYAITPDYFETLAIQLRAGRDFARTDTPDGPRVAIINETLARTAFPGESPLGRHIRTGTDTTAPWMEIIGVVADVRWQDPTAPPPPVLYMSSLQGLGKSLSLLVRTTLDEATVATTLRTLLHDANPTVPIRFETMETLFAEAVAYPRFRTQLIGAFAGAAVLLAAVGMFSVLAFLVGQRTGEIALRRAVGARTGDVVRLVVGHALRLIALGLVTGVAGALAAARLLAGFLFDAGPSGAGAYTSNGVVLGAVVLLIGAIGVVACALPVRRALRIQPTDAMRQT